MSELKYVVRRRTEHLAALGNAEIERRLVALVRHFKEPWLSAEGDHPVQKLWSRRDGLATIELVLLGDAVLFGEAMDATWLARQVKDIKTGPRNNRRGAMFELLGANLIKGPSISPTPKAFPGFDLRGRFEDGSQTLVSLKSYGESVHETQFAVEGRSVENAFLARLKSLSMNGICLRAVAGSYPSKADWKQLRDTIRQLIPGATLRRGVLHSVGIWAVALVDCPQEVQPIASGHLSAQVLFLAPFHQNESKNLLDKLDEAAVNARKHARANADNCAHLIVVRIPETMPLGTCAIWAKEYVASNAAGPVDAVLLYQPTVVDTDEGETRLDHGHFECCIPSFTHWSIPTRRVTYSPLIGSASNGSQRRLLNAPAEVSVDNMYVYQRGNFYTVFKPKSPDEPLKGQVDNLASGIVRHAVMKMGDEDGMLLSGIFPPKKSLSIFD